MAGAAEISALAIREPLVILVSAAVVVPFFYRLRVSPVLGFILCGIVLGPGVLGTLAPDHRWLYLITIQDREAIAPIAELGIVFLLFAIGLELSFERLMLLRKLVFGLGTLQMAVSSVGIAAVCWLAFGLSGTAAAIIGLALGLSSTAVVLQTLAEQNRLTSPTGRGSFGVLLFQDLAVVPILFAVSMLAPDRLGSGVGGLAQALIAAGVAVVLVIFVGRLVLRPLFRQAARTGSPEVFMALCLLVVISIGLVTAAAGLSMALGAFIAGLLLAETEYRRQVETTIEPFKGLLLGVFLVSVGMSVDVQLFLEQPWFVLAAVAGLILFKAGVVRMLSPLFGLKAREATQSGLLLGPGGEFAFVVLALAVAQGSVSEQTSNFVLVVTTVSMCLIPLLSHADKLGNLVSKPSSTGDSTEEISEALEEDSDHVIVAGYGRVGETVVGMLERHNVSYVAIDSSPDQAAKARRLGRRVYYGNAASPEYLHACGLKRAKALVVTMSGNTNVETVITSVRAEQPDLPIICRAKDGAHAAHLYGKGVREAVPETFEASLQLAEALLVEVGIPMGNVIVSVHERRDEFRDMLIEASSATLPSERLRVLRDTEQLKAQAEKRTKSAAGQQDSPIQPKAQA